MFFITKEWLNDNRTSKGGFTKSQLNSIGVTWPPKKNWLREMIGKEITLESKLKFEGTKINKKSYYIYAMSAGSHVKIGYSSDIQSRLKSMQTAQPVPVKVIWTLCVGTSESEASKVERNLHKICKEYKVLGEWFNSECMIKVREFSK